MVIADPQDFTNVCAEIGEAVIIYAPTQTFDTDYDEVATSTLGAGTSEVAVVQPAEEGEWEKYAGKIVFGDIEVFFKNNSVIARDSIIQVSGTSKYYRVIYLEQVRIGNVVHHYESLLRFIK